MRSAFVSHSTSDDRYRAEMESFLRAARYDVVFNDVSAAADLGAAEKLINDCGYHRRDDELADAKAAILSR